MFRKDMPWPRPANGGRRSDRRVQSVLVLAPGEIPTTTLYLPRILGEAAQAALEVADSLMPPGPHWTFGEDVWVVIIRHAEKPWANHLAAHKDRICRVTYFADDDIPAISSSSQLPADYVRKTASNYRSLLRNFRGLIDDLAVSTPELARRCGSPHVTVWPPIYPAQPTGPRPLCFFYHGTAAHLAEIEWLVPVVEGVQRTVPHAWFEIISTVYAKNLFKGIPRVRCLHPMTWPDYMSYTATFPQDVGLAPMLETPFNNARSHAKLYDITRCGAAGIYSSVGPYRDNIVDGETGILLPNDPQLWTDAVAGLLRNPVERTRLHANALAFCEATSVRTGTQRDNVLKDGPRLEK